MKTKAIPIVMAALIVIFIFAPTIVSAETVEEWNKQGISFFTSGEYEHAIECFDTIIEQNPNLDVPYSNRGAVFFLFKAIRKSNCVL